MSCPTGTYCPAVPVIEQTPTPAPPTPTPTPAPAPPASEGSGNWLVDQILSGLARSVGDAAEKFMSWLWNGVNQGTAVNLSQAPEQFLRLMGVTVALGLLIALGAFVWEIASAALHGGDLPRIGEALKGILVATLGPAITLYVINLLLTVSDQLSAGIIDVGMGGNMGGRVSFLVSVAVVVNPLGVLGMGALMILLGFFQWVVLSLQASLVWLEVLVLPIAFGGAPHPALRPLIGKWMGFTLGCIFIKPLLLGIVAVGLALAGNGVSGSPQQLGMGIAIMALSILAPFTLMQILAGLGEGLAAAGAAGGQTARGANPSSKIAAVARTRYYFRK